MRLFRVLRRIALRGEADRHLAGCRYQEAKVCLKELVGLEPASKVAMTDLGAVNMELGQLSEAEACFSSVLARYPGYGSAWFNLGSLYMRHLSRHADALACYKEAIRCDPKDEDSVCFAAEALQRLNRSGEAMQLLDEAVAARPHFAKAIAMRKAISGSFTAWLDDLAKG